MSGPPFTIRPLGEDDRTGFSCGQPALDAYFRTQATQDMRRRVAACFIAVHSHDGVIAGYYTLSACHLNLSALGEDWRRKLPRYPAVPAARIGRLAVDRRFQGRHLGGALLANAAARVIRSDLAAAIIVVDAKDDAATAFYEHHGFRRDPDDPRRLYVPVKSLAQLLGQ